MDINRIRYFLSVVKTGSITKAAELHHISAPALSKAIKVFERELDEKLLLPDGRGILLTDRARALAPALEEVVKKLDGIINKADLFGSFAGELKPLRIATFEVFSTHFMERILSNTFSGRSFLIHELTPGRMEQAVAGREADFAITYIPVPHPELDHLRVQAIEMGIFGLKNKFNEHAEDVPFVSPIGPIEGSPNRVRGLDGWPEEAFPRHIRYRVGMLETALGICRRGLAVAYIPKFIAKMHNEIVKPEFALEEKPLPRRFPRRKEYVYLVKRKTDLEDEAAKKLGAALRRYCSS
ncbi:LysR family transcriptional regulator [Bdellovibrio sp. HCB117]|uniref:LysR family transcriptional regulator n=1 Tax=Bdellovibrio sp. HCB117 TaxID=3394359 RepID=UPI0039B58A43